MRRKQFFLLFIALVLALCFICGALAASEIAPKAGPNTPETAIPIAFDKTIKATLTGEGGTVCYSFKLTKSKAVQITLTSYVEDLYFMIVRFNNSYSCPREEQVLCAEVEQTKQGTSKKPVLLTFKNELPAGLYTIEVCSWTSGRYDLSLKEWKRPALKKIALPKTMKLAPGFSKKLSVTIVPSDAARPSLAYSSKTASIASVDSGGIVTAKKKGKTVVTAKVAGTNKSAKCTVQVVDNKFGRSKPLKGSKKGIYVSTKSMFYSGNKLVAEIFVYNKTGKTIKKIENTCYFILGELYINKDGELDYRELDYYECEDWLPKKTFKNNTYQVIRAEFPKAKNPNLYLPEENYVAIFDFEPLFVSYKAVNDMRIIPVAGENRELILKR